MYCLHAVVCSSGGSNIKRAYKSEREKQQQPKHLISLSRFSAACVLAAKVLSRTCEPPNFDEKQWHERSARKKHVFPSQLTTSAAERILTSRRRSSGATGAGLSITLPDQTFFSRTTSSSDSSLCDFRALALGKQCGCRGRYSSDRSPVHSRFFVPLSSPLQLLNLFFPFRL